MDIYEAARASHIHWGNCTRSIGTRGGIKEHSTVCKVNGVLKVWKTRPNDFRLPVKHGLRGYGEVTPENISQYHLESECPLRDSSGNVPNDKHVTRIQTVTVPMLAGKEFYRVICTCGFIGREHFFAFETDEDAREHSSVAN